MSNQLTDVREGVPIALLKITRRTLQRKIFLDTLEYSPGEAWSELLGVVVNRY